MKKTYTILILIILLVYNISLLLKNSSMEKSYEKIISQVQEPKEDTKNSFSYFNRLKALKNISNVEEVSIQENKMLIKINIVPSDDIKKIQAEISNTLKTSPNKINIYDDKYLTLEYID